MPVKYSAGPLPEAYGPSKVSDRAEGSPPNPFACDLGKPALYLVQPGSTGWGEVNVVARVSREPLLHFRMFVRSVVVENQVNGQTAISRRIDLLEEAYKFLVPMLRLAVSNHLSGNNVQRGE